MSANQVLVKHVEYRGREMYRPNCAFSRMLCDLLGRKSFSLAKLRCLKKHGYEVVVEEEKI